MDHEPQAPLPPLRLRLPATSANLGPGFDAVGLALSLYLTIEARLAETFWIEATGRDAEICGSLANNLVLMTYNEVLGDLGLAAPPLSLRLHNEIPLGMGCGSSAAALLAGVFLANHFGELRWSEQQILDESATREGHPDNVAACLHGGLTVSSMTPAAPGSPAVTVTATLGANLNWYIMLALPAEGLATSRARELLPRSYDRADAVANVQATALLVAAFALDRIDLLPFAMRDRLHQPFRSSACPLLPALLPLVGQGGICGVALSGAGPAALLIAEPTAEAERVQAAVVNAATALVAELLPLGIGEAATVKALNG